MSVDLAVDNDLSKVVQQVKDQHHNNSSLYLSSEQVAVGSKDAYTTTSFTVHTPAGMTAIATVRPDDDSRYHWLGIAGDKQVFLFRTHKGGLELDVNGTPRLIISADGAISLLGDVTIEGNLSVDGKFNVDP